MCGWPLHGPRCDACGEFPAPLALEDSKRRFVPKGHTRLDGTGLEKAVEAFRRGEYARAISATLATETSFSGRSVTLPEGQGFSILTKSANVFVALDMSSMLLTIESPVARLPERERVPAMRFALELCDLETMSSRLCLRDDLFVLRYVSQLGAASPPLIRHVVREMLALSEHYAELFIASFDARPASSGEGRSAGGWDALGRKRTLVTLQIPQARRSVAPPPPSTLRPAETNVSADDELPPILSPLFASASEGTSRKDDDALPPVLAPMFAESPAPSTQDSFPALPVERMPQTARLGGIAPLLGATHHSERDIPPETARLGAIPSLTTPLHTQQGPARRRTVPGMAIPTVDTTARPVAPEIEAPDATSRRYPSRLMMRDSDAPADKLCELLHQAQTLATALSYAELPATMLLLVRAAVYRAVYEFGETVPDAVSYLYRTTATMTRILWPSTSRGGKRPTGTMPTAEPALLAMERIVGARALLPKERPYALDPISTAAAAKEHLSRYIEEIEAAPPDPALRHFLALGALSELLVRTRLPAQTSQRIKDIVAHAQRDAARQTSIELMMTALKRIVAG